MNPILNLALKINEFFYEFALLVEEVEGCFDQIRKNSQKTACDNKEHSSDIGQGLEGKEKTESQSNQGVDNNEECRFFRYEAKAFLFFC